MSYSGRVSGGITPRRPTSVLTLPLIADHVSNIIYNILYTVLLNLKVTKWLPVSFSRSSVADSLTVSG